MVYLIHKTFYTYNLGNGFLGMDSFGSIPGPNYQPVHKDTMILKSGPLGNQLI